MRVKYRCGLMNIQTNDEYKYRRGLLFKRLYAAGLA